jgi:hypothetical protein
LVLGIATLGVVLASFAKKNMLAFFISLLLFAMIFQPLQAISYARSMGYNNQKRLISRTLLKEQRKVVVVTNIVEKNVGSYYLSFDTSYVVFKSFDEIDSLPLSTKYPVYLLLDGFSNTMAGKSWEDLPEYAKNTAGYITLDSEGGASLFQVNKKQ